MQYKCGIEIACLLFIVIIVLHSVVAGRSRSGVTRIFKMLLLTSVLECGVNLLSCIIMANAEFVPQGVNGLLTFVFFLLEGFGFYLLLCYFRELCRGNRPAAKISRLSGTFPPVLYAAVSAFLMIIQYRFWDSAKNSAVTVLLLCMAYLILPAKEEGKEAAGGLGYAFLYEVKRLRKHNAQFSILTIEIRQLAYLKKVLGYENCGRLLQEVLKYLSLLCKETQVFYNMGEVFTVLAVSPEESRRIQEAVEKRFCQEWKIQKNRILLDCSVIIQSYPQEFASVSEYMGMREFLLEKAGQIPEQKEFQMNEEYLMEYRRMEKVKAALVHALHDKSLEVCYQPVFSANEKRIVFLEAAVRLKDRELGTVLPEEFISLAQRDGSIQYLEEQVLEQCCKFISQHILPAVSLGIGAVHVRISPIQCMRGDLAQRILPILEKYHVPPSMLVLIIAGVHSGEPSFGSILDEKIKVLRQCGISVEEADEKMQGREPLCSEDGQSYSYGEPMPEMECLRYIRNLWAVPEEYGKK